MTIRRAVRFIAAAIFCAFIAFATLVIGVLIYGQADEAKAQIAAFIGASLMDFSVFSGFVDVASIALLVYVAALVLWYFIRRGWPWTK